MTLFLSIIAAISLIGLIAESDKNPTLTKNLTAVCCISIIAIVILNVL